jgi:hypothetical protein
LSGRRRCDLWRFLSVGFNRDVKHCWLVGNNFDRRLAARKIECAFLQHDGVVAADRPTVLVRGSHGRGSDRPSYSLANLVNAARVVRREDEVLRNLRALRIQRRGGKRQHEDDARQK